MSARLRRCHVPLKQINLHVAIAAEVAAKPDAILDEMRQWLSVTHTMTASTGLMFKTLTQLRLKSRQERTDYLLDGPIVLKKFEW